MGKIYYSALVNTIRGKVSFSVMSAWKGINVVKRHNPNPRQPRSEKQQDLRGMLNNLAGEWYSLSDIQKDLWNSFCAMYKLTLTGLNAYVKFNQVLQKYLPGTARKTEPPPSPATPEFALGFTVTPVAGGDFCVIWTSPTLTTLYAITDYWPMPGLDSTNNPRWTFGGTAGCDATFIDLDLDMPAGVIVKFRLRTMDAHARLSPWSHILSTTALAA
jgi:hypothetical protein